VKAEATCPDAPSDPGAADLAHIRAFLNVPTPVAWVDAAVSAVDVLLIDHANCEKKAAGTAIGLLYRYDDRPQLLNALARLAREELRHFQEILRAMESRGIKPRRLAASRYAAGLFALVSRSEPARLIDTLIVAAIVEARSCERFAALATRLQGSLGRLYAGLLASEARHFQTYLDLARDAAGAEAPAIEGRIAEMLAVEGRLITTPDEELRFHSGPPPVRRAAGHG